MAAVSSSALPLPRGIVRAQPRAWLHVALAAAVFAVSLAALGLESASAPFEADESDYVATSRYFGYLFLQRDVARQEWASNHWTRTQPPLTRYIVGAWLTGYGYDLEKMNQPYVSTASSFEVNRQKGRVPTDDVLARARQPMVLLGAGAIALLYVLGAMLGGAPVGLVTAALALTSPFFRYTMVHVWAEAPLAFFLVASAVLAAWGVKHVLHGDRGMASWSVGLGVALGLASATKLTGLVGVALTLAVGTLMAAWLWRRGDRATAMRLGSWAAGAATVALLVFVSVNPYLWRGPVSGLQGMLEERRDEMAFQQEQWPEYAVLGWAERPWLTLSGSVQVGPLAETPLALFVNIPLLAIGVVGLVTLLRRGGVISPTGMLATWMLGYACAVVLGLGLKYPRYFMPTTLLLLPVIALGLVTLLRQVRQRLGQTAKT